jgi:hypothetical protein
VKIVFTISTSGYWWDGNVHSATPGQPIEIDDANKKAVAWARKTVESGAADLLEDTAPPASAPASVPAKRGPGRPPKSLAAQAEK